MEFEVLKPSNLKRNIIIGVVAVLIISAIILNFTRAKYRVTESIPLVNGTINYSPGDIIISAYFNDKLLETFPTKDSGYTVESITCNNNATATFDEDAWKITVNNLATKGTKCDVTFKEIILAKDTILANSTVNDGTPDFSQTATTDKGVWTAQDNDGITYYWRGNPTDNWVRWAGYYWRIIRINGDGSLRLIYNGTSTTKTGTGTQIGTSSFNNLYNDNAGVGFKYTSGSVHGTGTNSTILTTLNNWYSNNLVNHAIDIDINAGFCNDRTPYSGSGIGTSSTDYAAYNRLRTNKAPSFKCKSSGDLFTISSSSKGNKALTHPIGLITADEVVYAGGLWGINNTSYYLYTGQTYWTMSPLRVDSNWNAYVFLVWGGGDLDGSFVLNEYGVRPVINLRADVQLTGSGTISDPYVVEGA